MSSSRYRLLRLLALLGALVCPLALLLLLEIRPPLPALPDSLSSPITLTLVQGVLDLAAWAAALAFACLLFAQSLRRLFARRPLPPARALRIDPARRRRPLAEARLAAGAAQGGFPPPFPLILRAPAEAPTEKPAAVPPPARSQHELPPPSIALLGPLAIVPSRPARYALRTQAQQLLAYLALHPEGASSDELVDLLCPKVADRIARKRLWRSVSETRSQLGDVIRRTDERYRLDREAVAIDLDRFDALVMQADQARGEERERLLGQALALVRGQPLAGSDFPWAAGDVRHLSATIIERLEDLGYLRLDDGNPTGALAAAEQALALDPYNEAGNRLAMRAEATLGLRQAIADRYQQLCHGLDSRFGLEPERETRLLYRHLLSQDAVDA
jgi:DNA-binding SARP family transcriptional activator